MSDIENKMVVDENWDEPKQTVYCVCEFCCNDIMDGDEYFDLDGQEICEDCFDGWAEKLKRIADCEGV